jgi:hypothetical protein
MSQFRFYRSRKIAIILSVRAEKDKQPSRAFDDSDWANLDAVELLQPSLRRGGRGNLVFNSKRFPIALAKAKDKRTIAFLKRRNGLPIPQYEKAAVAQRRRQIPNANRNCV